MTGGVLPSKLVAWYGHGLPVPPGWDLGRYRGDHLFGQFQVESDYRAVADVTWWQRRKALPAMVELARRSPALRLAEGEPRVLPASHLPPPDGVWRCTAVQGVTDQDQDHRPCLAALLAEQIDGPAAVMVRVMRQVDGPDDEQLRTMLAGVALPQPGQDRLFSVMGFQLRVPADWEVTDAALMAGVSQMSLAAGRGQIGWRRFTGLAMPGGAERSRWIEQWFRATYAAADHDMRYAPPEDMRIAGAPGLVFTATRSGRAAIGWNGLFPVWRRNPHRVVVMPDADRMVVQCFEQSRRGVEDETLHRFLAGAAGWTDDDTPVLPDAVTAAKLPTEQRRMLRWLATRVRQGADVRAEELENGSMLLHRPAGRPGRRRWLRALAGAPLDHAQPYTAGLDAVGVIVWDACVRWRSVEEIIRMVMRDRKLCRREARVAMQQYLHALTVRGLLRVDPDSAPSRGPSR